MFPSLRLSTARSHQPLIRFIGKRQWPSGKHALSFLSELLSCPAHAQRRKYRTLILLRHQNSVNTSQTSSRNNWIKHQTLFVAKEG